MHWAVRHFQMARPVMIRVWTIMFEELKYFMVRADKDHPNNRKVEKISTKVDLNLFEGRGDKLGAQRYWIYKNNATAA